MCVAAAIFYPEDTGSKLLRKFGFISIIIGHIDPDDQHSTILACFLCIMIVYAVRTQLS